MRTLNIETFSQKIIIKFEMYKTYNYLNIFYYFTRIFLEIGPCYIWAFQFTYTHLCAVFKSIYKYLRMNRMTSVEVNQTVVQPSTRLWRSRFGNFANDHGCIFSNGWFWRLLKPSNYREQRWWTDELSAEWMRTHLC